MNSHTGLCSRTKRYVMYTFKNVHLQTYRHSIAAYNMTCTNIRTSFMYSTKQMQDKYDHISTKLDNIGLKSGFTFFCFQ